MMTKKFGGWTAALLLALHAGAVSAAYQLNLSPGVTKATQVIYDLHNLMMWIILVIFVGVFAVMFWSVYAHRKSKGHKAANFHENTTVELIWTILPFFILIGMAWPATKSLLDIRDTSSPDMTIKATGSEKRMNYGELIEPRLLPDVTLAKLDGNPLRLADLRGKWVMLHIDEARCGKACREKLYNMRQVRLTQGKNMDRVLRLWVVTDEDPVDAALLRDFEGTLIVRAGSTQWLQQLPASGSQSAPIWLVDPLGNIMLRYSLNADPSGMKNDLLRLLKISRIQ